MQEHSANLSSGETVPIPVRTHEDMDANAKFISIYVPEILNPIDIAKYYVDNIEEALKVGRSVGVKASFGSLPPQMDNETLVFTGRFIVFSERRVPATEIEELREHSKKLGIHLVWYDPSYADQRSRFERPAAFISHDSRDKKEVVEKIVLGLQRLMCPVWYDEYSLAIGAPLRESIEKGIKESGKCIIVLSPNFFSNNGWTKTEFNTIFSREVFEQRQIILPVWHNVTKREVYEYCPMLVDRLAGTTELPMDELVRRLHRAINSAGGE